MISTLDQDIGIRLTSGNGKTMIIPRSHVLADRIVTYRKCVAAIHPNKEETHMVWLTVGGDKLDYPGTSTTQIFSLVANKTLLNSVIFTDNIIIMTSDINNYLCVTSLSPYEYMLISLTFWPLEVVLHYNLHDLEDAGWVYIKIRKVMPGFE